jgi:hypothetical protein
MYRELLASVMNSKSAALSMEWLWHALFTGKCHMELEGGKEAYHLKHFTCAELEPSTATAVARVV